MGAHLLLLWECPGDETLHRDMWRPEVLTFKKRHEKRFLFRGSPWLKELFDAERPVRKWDIDGEPYGLGNAQGRQRR